MNRFYLSLYSALKTLAIPFVFVWLSLFRRSYRRGFVQRLKVSRDDCIRPVIWLHASSLGEVNGVSPFVEALMHHFPHEQILFTVFTRTGLNQVKKRFGDRVVARYLPWDTKYVVKRFLEYYRPRILFVMETEIWPTIYTLCAGSKIPVALINARLSDKATAQYRTWRRILAPVLDSIRMICARSENDANRFHALGVNPEYIFVCGNIKYDTPLNERGSSDVKTKIKNRSRNIWIAASTHPGEEKIVFEAMLEIRRHFDNILILAPRHVDRAGEIERLATSYGFRCELRSNTSFPDEKTDVFIVDTFGELPMYYDIADIAFIGGSLIPVGGHNPIEPALCHCPIVSGVYVKNFQEEYDALQKIGAVTFVIDSVELAENVLRCFREPESFNTAKQAAYNFVNSNRGAVQRVLDRVGELVDTTPANY